jgi:hypothetical protein
MTAGDGKRPESARFGCGCPGGLPRRCENVANRDLVVLRRCGAIADQDARLRDGGGLRIQGTRV